MLSDDGRISVEIPAGTLPSDTVIDVRQIPAEDARPNPYGQPWEGPLYNLTPDGLEFAGPVTVTLRLEPEEAPAVD